MSCSYFYIPKRWWESCQHTRAHTRTHTRVRAPLWGLSTLAKEFTAAARIMQSSSNMVRLLAERSDTKSNVKLGGFDPSFKRPTCLATLKSCDTMKQSVCGWQYIYVCVCRETINNYLSKKNLKPRVMSHDNPNDPSWIFCLFSSNESHVTRTPDGEC